MYRRAIFVFVSVWAGVGLAALALSLSSEPTPTTAGNPLASWDVPPHRPMSKPAKKEPSVVRDAVDLTYKAMGIGSTLKISKLAFDLGLINKLPEPFDHRIPADAVKAAQQMHQAFPKEYYGDEFSYEISTVDGRLIARVSDDFQRLDEVQKSRRMGQLFRIWKTTKFTIDYGFSPTVEFRSKDGWTKTITQ